MRVLWMRAGISLRITEEEEKILFSTDYDKGAEIFKKIVAEGRFNLDGETYIPSEAVKDFNESNNTNYKVQEYGWDV